MKLLVSVRDAGEALEALAGRCDILDVKEPARGPLGMADVGMIGEVAALGMRHGVPVSVALGECQEWAIRLSGWPPESRANTKYDLRWQGVSASKAFNENHLSVLSQCSFVKLGLAGLASRRDWAAQWMQVREEIESLAGIDVAYETASVETVDKASYRPLKFPAWVAVAYADHEKCDAPSPGEVVTMAASAGCGGVLIDTWEKSGRTLLGCTAVPELAELCRKTRQAQMFFAVAGSLGAGEIESLKRCGANIFGVRGAACRDSQRESSISADAVRKLRQRLDFVGSESVPVGRGCYGECQETLTRFANGDAG